MDLISKYTEIAQVAQNVDLAVEDLEYCIAAKKIKIEPDLNSANVIGQKIEKETFIGGCQNGQPARAIEVDFDKNIGVQKKIMAQKYRPKIRISEQSQLEKAKTKRERMLEYAKKNSTKDKKTKLDRRQQVHDKYTTIDASTRERVRKEIEKNSYNLVPKKALKDICRHCSEGSQCGHCELNPYVVEQVRAKLLKGRRHKIELAEAMEGDNFETIENEVKNSSGFRATENRMQRLVNIINLMDVCLQ